MAGVRRVIAMILIVHRLHGIASTGDEPCITVLKTKTRGEQSWVAGTCHLTLSAKTCRSR